MKTIDSYYFKWSSHGQLMSGIKPKEEYRDIHFVNCDFHHNIHGNVKFFGCVFEDCNGPHDLEDCDAACSFICTEPCAISMELVLAIADVEPGYFHKWGEHVYDSEYGPQA